MLKIVIGIICIITAIALIIGIYNRNKFLEYINREIEVYDYIDDNDMVDRSKFYKEVYDELQSEITRLKSCRTDEELREISNNITVIENKINAHEIIGG